MLRQEVEIRVRVKYGFKIFYCYYGRIFLCGGGGRMRALVENAEKSNGSSVAYPKRLPNAPLSLFSILPFCKLSFGSRFIPASLSLCNFFRREKPRGMAHPWARPPQGTLRQARDRALCRRRLAGILKVRQGRQRKKIRK